MQLMVIGAGLMGPAAAYNAMIDPDVTRVTICDRDPGQLDAALARLAPLPGSDKVHGLQLDLADAAAPTHMAQHQAIVAALPSTAIPLGLGAALAAGVPWIDLTWPPADALPALRGQANALGVLVIPGCGLEPGLTEIMARHLAEQLDQVDELHIKCGGIPITPNGPLGYKIVFGGRALPLRDLPARVAEQGRLREVERYSGVERFHVAGVGEVEAWHEGFMPWLLELDALRGLRLGTQKTVRWPGYAAKAAVLRELGLLSQAPVQVGDAAVSPKAVVDAVLYPHVRMGEEDRDITVFQVAVSGQRRGQPASYVMEMVDRYDEVLGFTSMARTTAFTGAIVARMVLRGEIRAAGWTTPEQAITGPLLQRLIAELAAAGIHFQLASHERRHFTRPLDQPQSTIGNQHLTVND